MNAREKRLREFCEFWFRSLLSLKGTPLQKGEEVKTWVLCVSGGTYATLACRANEYQVRGASSEHAFENLARHLFDKCREVENEKRWKQELAAWTEERNWLEGS